MMLRRGWVLYWVLCLGCQSVSFGEGDAEPESSSTTAAAGPAARPVGFFEPRLAADPGATRSRLSLAADHLAKGEERAACACLADYLTDHPEHDEVRLHYA